MYGNCFSKTLATARAAMVYSIPALLSLGTIGNAITVWIFGGMRAKAPQGHTFLLRDIYTVIMALALTDTMAMWTTLGTEVIPWSQSAPLLGELMSLVQLCAIGSSGCLTSAFAVTCMVNISQLRIACCRLFRGWHAIFLAVLCPVLVNIYPFLNTFLGSNADNTSRNMMENPNNTNSSFSNTTDFLTTIDGGLDVVPDCIIGLTLDHNILLANAILASFLPSLLLLMAASLFLKHSASRKRNSLLTKYSGMASQLSSSIQTRTVIFQILHLVRPMLAWFGIGTTPVCILYLTKAYTGDSNNELLTSAILHGKLLLVLKETTNFAVLILFGAYTRRALYMRWQQITGFNSKKKNTNTLRATGILLKITGHSPEMKRKASLADLANKRRKSSQRIQQSGAGSSRISSRISSPETAQIGGFFEQLAGLTGGKKGASSSRSGGTREGSSLSDPYEKALANLIQSDTPNAKKPKTRRISHSERPIINEEILVHRLQTGDIPLPVERRQPIQYRWQNTNIARSEGLASADAEAEMLPLLEIPPLSPLPGCLETSLRELDDPFQIETASKMQMP